MTGKLCKLIEQRDAVIKQIREIASFMKNKRA